MEITVNDKKREVADGLVLSALMEELQVPERGTAVAVNDTLARRPDWESITLRPGDNVLIISAAYGG